MSSTEKAVITDGFNDLLHYVPKSIYNNNTVYGTSHTEGYLQGISFSLAIISFALGKENYSHLVKTIDELRMLNFEREKKILKEGL